MTSTIKLPGLLAMTLALSCASVIAQAQTAQMPLNDSEKALHVLNRLAYGPRPGDVDTVRHMGVKRYIDQQLRPDSLPLPEALSNQLSTLPTYQLNATQLYQQYGPPSFPPNSATPEEKNMARQRANKDITPQVHFARLWQATESPRQLQEVMSEFWFNHFNVFEGKDWVRYWNGEYERDVLRPNALGNFRQLLGSVAHHPAMLYYLDNWLSSGVNTPEAKGRFKGLNENYGRELLELHTMGVDSGYTQADVISLARILTGWTIDEKGMKDGQAAFVFNPRRHDFGDKVFLGQTIKGSGEQEGEQALDILARHPATAHFIAIKLVQYFVSDKPEPALTEKLARRFLATNGDIKAVLRTLFDSQEFWARSNYQTQFKTPYQYVVSSLRATATPVLNYKPIDGVLNQLGQPMYGWLTPEGYKFSEEAWLNPDALLRRINFVNGLSNGKSPIARAETPPLPPGSPPPVPLPTTPVDPQQLMQTLSPALAPHSLAAITAAPPNLQVGLILGGPDFMKR
ncbi:putative signal peptide protein [Collimonas arenae]|uniref:Putative signal peptide protein n=1 Tax=Collimonas arenae TaxID=279058 RepID=A0A0A1FAY6_9BURK|nr:putative signal peptide protein [Collimonas arenae]